MSGEVPLTPKLSFAIIVFLLWIALILAVSFVIFHPVFQVDATPDPAKMPGRVHKSQ